ncbi:transcriptional regulation of mitochondrial recombination-domain-containing protein [Daldinia caldariorum]|uniref:transcriptional regulation of mitochondrial recombination-domain-containing protein n=1 Tax=Daldinia caldariorum TaxID=326644 RepID=UPI002007FAD2|nr:transcriptional regulation of mitochondrial recombination-domain-containing protein [Daldinia caldariorum]KAI1467181.1 transcriptional regulation of mitochondrial recombination-domain-containing protein [Daldinia caldariorum]
MALRVNSITAQFTRLPLSPLGTLTISCIGIRFKSTAPTKEKREKEIAAAQFPPHHGEKIWMFSHILDGMMVYSHRPVLKANKSLRQIAFTGKKLKPSKFRKDYWRPFALIQFPEGFGAVGRSVYARLRECKKLHELSWSDEMLFDKNGHPLTKLERGAKVNDLKTSTIADVAAVLRGLGKGNKIWVPMTDDPNILVNLDAADEKNLKKEEDGSVKARLKVQIWWRDDKDRHFAESWPPNVSHYRFDQAAVEEMGTAEEENPEENPDAKEEEEAKEGQEQEGTEKEGAEKEGTEKKAADSEAADEKPADQQKTSQKTTDQKGADQKSADRTNSV